MTGPPWRVIRPKAEGPGPPGPLFHGPQRQLEAGGGKNTGLRLSGPPGLAPGCA